jgi:hypothetical protein
VSDNTDDPLVAAYKDALANAQRAHRADINRIAAELLLSLDGDVYDDLIGSLAGELHIPLPDRERPFVVRRTYTVTVECEIDATDANAAMDAAGKCEFDVAGRYRWDITESDLNTEEATPT